jgi:hypothetical protein
MNFKQQGAQAEQVIKSLEAMIRFGKFAADSLIIDGYDFSLSSAQDLRKFKDFAGKLGLEIWYSASLKDNGNLYDEEGVPAVLKRFMNEIDVLITLHFKDDQVQLRVVKDHNHPPSGELPLKLDPKTLLIAEKA